MARRLLTPRGAALPDTAGRRRQTASLVCAVATLLGGCSHGVLDPRGPVARDEVTILFNSLGIMLAIVVPTILAIFAVAWWFRATNARARYLPDWEYSGRIEMLVWSIPTMTILLLGGIGWVGSHALDPYRPLRTAPEAETIEVVSLDWKWLFIYPREGVASVNRLVLPAGTPVRFLLTSDGVMNSFFVPQLGSQIYAMAGMVTQLRLQADKPGHFPGLSAQFSGDGFSDMRFAVDAMPEDAYQAWIAEARQSGPVLDMAAYRALAAPSRATPAATYRSPNPGLFTEIIRTVAASAPAAQSSMPGMSGVPANAR